MVDWTQSMAQTFKYYTVNPNTWMDVREIKNVKSCTITRDSEAETLGSATIDTDEDLGETYVRIYLITIQNGVEERHPLGTFLAQTPAANFDGKSSTASVDAYTPLLELKENPPPLGYSLLKGENIMDIAYRLVREKARAPVVRTENSQSLYYDFIANTNDTWLSYIRDLIANAKYTFALDELGRILFSPKQDTASLQPVWTYDSGNSSILYPDISRKRDLYGIPNVVEVTYSNGAGTLYARVVNDDPNSPVSTVNRGREITRRINNPDLNGDPTQYQINQYAEQALRDLSSLECTITYKHGYCPVRMDDCVLLDYPEAGLNNVKARVISQTIDCSAGCRVTEKAIYTTKLWG